MSGFKMESRLRSIHFASTSEPINSPPIANKPARRGGLVPHFRKADP
jgi:hypothetical protein